MKKCTDCGCILIVNDNWSENNKKRKYYICTCCHKEYDKKRYIKYKDTTIKAYRLKNKEKIMAYNNAKHTWLRLFKESQGCAICGYNKCGDALVYHHIEPKEKRRIIAAHEMYHGHKETYDELLKCILLCSNCHIETHYLIRHQSR